MAPPTCGVGVSAATPSDVAPTYEETPLPVTVTLTVTSCVCEKWAARLAVHSPMPVAAEGALQVPDSAAPFTETESDGLQPGVQPEVSLLQRSSQTW